LQVKVYDLNSGKLLSTLYNHTWTITCINLADSPENLMVTGCGDRRYIYLYYYIIFICKTRIGVRSSNPCTISTSRHLYLRSMSFSQIDFQWRHWRMR